jgi:hypothetical protein
VELLASLVVHKPLNIVIVAAVFGILYAVRRITAGAECHTGLLLVAVVGWLLYAAWEWLVMTRTPEANIRVDLLLIWPVLLVLSVWGLIRAFKP